jgi:hypothetical protein
MKILAFDKACDPDEGSEPGAGWTWSRMLAQLGASWVITRSNNRAPIETALNGVPERNKLRFVYVHVPKWLRFWKKGRRGVHGYHPNAFSTRQSRPHVDTSTSTSGNSQ